MRQPSEVPAQGQWRLLAAARHRRPVHDHLEGAVEGLAHDLVLELARARPAVYLAATASQRSSARPGSPASRRPPTAGR